MKQFRVTWEVLVEGDKWVRGENDHGSDEYGATVQARVLTRTDNRFRKVQVESRTVTYGLWKPVE